MSANVERHSVLIRTPYCGDVYVAAIADSNILECFWHSELSTKQRTWAGNWLAEEGWFNYANGALELDQGLFDRIQDEPEGGIV